MLVPFFAEAPPALWPHLLLIEDGRNAWKQDLLGLLERSGYVTVRERQQYRAATAPEIGP